MDEDTPQRKAITAELGVTGLKRSGGVVLEEFLPDLSGSKAAAVYAEMHNNSSIVGACALAIETVARQAKWRVDPGSGGRRDRDFARFVDDARQDMSHTWDDLITGALTKIIYGWSFAEIVYKLRNGYHSMSGQRSMFSDGAIGWRKMPMRNQDTLFEWIFDPTGGIKGMVQMAPPDYKTVPIPIEKALLFRTTVGRGNPEGRSLLRPGYRDWYYLKRMQEYEAIGVERDLAGIPKASVPSEILREDADADEQALLRGIENLVKTVRRDHAEGIIWPKAFDEKNNSLFDFELMGSGGARSFSTDVIIQRYERRLATIMLADFILLGHEKVGSFALSSDKTALFGVALGAWLEAIADVINRHAIPRLFKLNNWAVEKLPQVHVEDIESPELGQLGSYLAALSGIGVPLMPDPDLENYLRSAARLPMRSAETIALHEQQQAQQEGGMGMEQEGYGLLAE